MVYTSDDNDFSDELPDIQLLLEQRLAKGAGAALDTAAELPPSLFDPITPPKPKPIPKPKSQSTRLEPKSKPGTVRKHKGAVETPGNSIPQVPKEVGAKKVTVAKKQIKKATAEDTIITGKTVSGAGRKPRGGHVEVPSLTETASEASDYASAAENVIEREEPAPRRRRLIQKKYLPSSEDGDDDDDEGEKDKEQETVKKPQRPFIDLTGSEEEEGSPQALVPQVPSTISEDDDNGFTLKYSPPRSSKPRKAIAPATSAKGPVTGRKLGSPTKKAPKIPPSQHRKSSDAFWDQGATNTWIDAHTPHKTPSGGLWGRGVTVEEEEEEEEDDDDMFEGEEGGDTSEEGEDEDEEETRPTTKHTTSKAKPKGPKENTESKRAFNARKKRLAEDFFKLIDDKIGGGEVARKAAATGGVKIVWSKTLRTTAGTAKWRAEKLQNISAQAALEHPMSTERVKHHATIELAEKVVDSQEKLYNTMCHEYCHMANYMISYVRKPAHGAEFKRWAAKCSREFGHLGVIVTTKHSYEIDAKFKWTCQTPGCGQVYKRHSKSIDITRSRCGVCKVGTLLQTHPPLKEKRPITGYQSFMKENFRRIKAENPGVPQRDIMKIVAQAYRESKATEPEEVGKGFVETGEKEGGLETMLGGLKV